MLSMRTVVQTNLLGTLLGFKAAMIVMAGQDKGGHIFNMDGAGSNGMVPIFRQIIQQGGFHEHKKGIVVKTGQTIYR